MEIRILEETELANAAGLSRYVFDNCVKYRMEFAPTIGYVENYLSAENLMNLRQEGRLTLWGVFEQEQMVGVSGLQSDGMITMLYILPQCFKRGYGNALLCEMRQYARDTWGKEVIHVNATPAWTSTYFVKQGFSYVNRGQDMHVPFVPMYIDTKNIHRIAKKHVSSKVIAGAIAGCFLFATIVCVAFLIAYVS